MSKFMCEGTPGSYRFWPRGFDTGRTSQEKKEVEKKELRYVELDSRLANNRG
jgi:hypothetical protein